MAEVFSINGPPDPRQYGRRYGRTPGPYGHRQGQPHPGFGAFGACPAGFKTTPNQNCQGSAAVVLQNALKALGNTVRDGVLMKITADGSIGPSTASAVNRAFTTHIGSGQAPAQFRTGALSIMDVAANAAPLTQLINAETMRRGGSTTVQAVPVPAPGKALPSPYPTVTPPPAAADAGTGFHLSPVAWAGIGVGVLVLGIGVYMFATSGPGGPAPSYEPGGSHVVRAGRGKYAVV